jgi:hypothetical protein
MPSDSKSHKGDFTIQKLGTVLTEASFAKLMVEGEGDIF